jgi:hypothetical protein
MKQLCRSVIITILRVFCFCLFVPCPLLQPSRRSLVRHPSDVHFVTHHCAALSLYLRTARSIFAARSHQQRQLLLHVCAVRARPPSGRGWAQFMVSLQTFSSAPDISETSDYLIQQRSGQQVKEEIKSLLESAAKHDAAWPVLCASPGTGQASQPGGQTRTPSESGRRAQSTACRIR